MKNNTHTINMLSLFSGGGGMDLGFEGDFEVLTKSVNITVNNHWNISKGTTDDWTHLEKTGVNTIFANDVKAEARNAWTNYFSKKDIDPSVYHLGSIVDFVKSFHEGEDVFPQGKDVDIVTGGFPCQDFSVAGKRKGFNSTKSHNGKQSQDSEPSLESRGQLYMWMKEVISIVKPKLFIAENVKGLVNLNDVKQVIENDFRSIADDGYLVVEGRVLHSADFGVPQSRERVFFFGFKKSALSNKALLELSKKSIAKEYDPFPSKTHNYTPTSLLDFSEDLLPPVTVLDCFVGLQEPSLSCDLAQQQYSKAKYMGKHCQGQSEVNLSGIGPTIRSEHHGNIEYRRLSKENGGKNISELEFGLPERRLTVRECARIQTFPDDYEFVFKSSEHRKSLSASSGYKIIGNAVPPLLAYHIAKKLEDNWSLYFD